VKRRLLRIAVILSALAVAASGSWYIWREFYSAEQFRAAVVEGIETGDLSRAERLKKWGADTEVWRIKDSGGQPRGRTFRVDKATWRVSEIGTKTP